MGVISTEVTRMQVLRPGINKQQHALKGLSQGSSCIARASPDYASVPALGGRSIGWEREARSMHLTPPTTLLKPGLLFEAHVRFHFRDRRVSCRASRLVGSQETTAKLGVAGRLKALTQGWTLTAAFS